MKFINNNINIHDMKYLYDNNIIPDTDEIIYEITGYLDNKYNNINYIILSKEESKNFKSAKEELYLLFYAPIYTNDYINKCKKIIKKYNESKDYVDYMMLNDEQFDDPSLWYASLELNKIQDNKVKNYFWDYMIH